MQTDNHHKTVAWAPLRVRQAIFPTGRIDRLMLSVLLTIDSFRSVLTLLLEWIYKS
jgi:hypothetical protein